MAIDLSKNIELYLLKAENFDEKITPNQKKYYLEAAQWLKDNQENFNSLEEVTEGMKNTKYYEGGGIAHTADEILYRMLAMKEVGYDDVAAIHEERKKKFDERGNAYAFSQEWIDDYNRVSEATAKYAERKETFGLIFIGYLQIMSNPQQEHRVEGAKEISKGLRKLEELGTSFEELAAQRAYRMLTLTTEKGMENFIAYVRNYIANGEKYVDELCDLQKEQDEIGNFLKEHREEIIEAGKSEPWNTKRANCIAVPSDDPTGYDFIEIRYQDIH